MYKTFTSIRLATQVMTKASSDLRQSLTFWSNAGDILLQYAGNRKQDYMTSQHRRSQSTTWIILMQSFLFVHVDGVRPRLWTEVTNGPIVHPPGDIWAWRATVEWYWQGKLNNLEKKPVPVPLCLTQIPHGLTRERTRASVVRSQQLTDLKQWHVE
jgi:hypothetical protein